MGLMAWQNDRVISLEALLQIIVNGFTMDVVLISQVLLLPLLAIVLMGDNQRLNSALKALSA
ncbi:MAG: hypothetical protein ACI8Z1_000806 [Candidatus Azotimanducaceae bacterium]|jgi:hypothetical protein